MLLSVRGLPFPLEWGVMNIQKYGNRSIVYKILNTQILKFCMFLKTNWTALWFIKSPVGRKVFFFCFVLFCFVLFCFLFLRIFRVSGVTAVGKQTFFYTYYINTHINRGVTSDQLFVILVEIFVVPLNKWKNALCSVWFCHFTPWTWLLKFTHFCPLGPIVHCNTLFRVTFRYFGSIKNLLGSLNFLEPFQKVQ